MSPQSSSENRSRGPLPNVFYEIDIILTSKPNKDIIKKEKKTTDQYIS